LANELGLKGDLDYFEGEIINQTENRAVFILHYEQKNQQFIYVNGTKCSSEIYDVKKERYNPRMK
jgi:glucose-6-phosphate isomerase